MESPTTSPATSDTTPHGNPAWAQDLLGVLRVASMDELHQRTYLLAGLGQCISGFMRYWMDTLGRHNRKLMSYTGALRYRQGMDGFLSCEGDWTDPVSGQRYFDPGNDIYSRAFYLAFPDLADQTSPSWNACTQGEMFEGILALKWLDDFGAVRKYRGYPHFPANGPAARIAAWIEELVTLVWAVSLIYPVTESPAEWACRWHVQV